MNDNIRFKDTVTIGFMLFALFFGAGNLVFPAMLGQQAGDQYGFANLGFLITGVGLPILGTLAFGFSGSKDLLDLTSRVHPWFGIGFTTMLYLTIGPLFAMPRTGSVSYEIGLKPFIGAQHDPLLAAAFTIIFFGVTLLFSLRPAKIIDIVGKGLTPALIILIALLAFAAVAAPLGPPQQPLGDYSAHAFFNGFQEGYLTMDTLAALVFGILVIDAIRAKGAVRRRHTLLVCFQASAISAAILGLIYTALAFIGAGSVSAFGRLGNGGEVLQRTADYYFGTFGGAVLGVIVLLACLTTSIGLATSCSSYFHTLFPKMSYRRICVILTAASALIANAGLEKLISFSVPVLTILYPLAIALILLTFAHDRFQGKRSVYGWCLLLTFIVSLVSGLAGTPLRIEWLHVWFTQSLPLYDIGLGWVLPACAGALLGLLWPKTRPAES
ncbi:branched-chain amino acid transport system II carrier protein [Paenibacillus antri]|uniref:Branched-chain amino acid transport system carrier protein n=1 Tax=Paenibacillus antri TaxID=2582848 RepID=A0A5R9G6B1_9BACL|nr:branched-chain amino acid transport system II carrier protein [Paenibacillus antri]TLS51922.1 branched-chain amino acid transport system II carrier protein [Paenibacillus antri]